MNNYDEEDLLIDDVIDEPLIGAHRDKEGAAKALGDYFLSAVAQMNTMTDEERMQKRYTRLTSHGAFTE